MAVRLTLLPRVGGGAISPEATSWTKLAQLDKLRSDRSFAKPPGGGPPSLGGGITKREQALRAWTCTRLSSCKGARRALMYLLAPSIFSNREGRSPQGSPPQNTAAQIPTYNNQETH